MHNSRLLHLVGRKCCTSFVQQIFLTGQSVPDSYMQFGSQNGTY